MTQRWLPCRACPGAGAFALALGGWIPREGALRELRLRLVGGIAGETDPPPMHHTHRNRSHRVPAGCPPPVGTSLFEGSFGGVFMPCFSRHPSRLFPRRRLSVLGSSAIVCSSSRASTLPGWSLTASAWWFSADGETLCPRSRT